MSASWGMRRRRGAGAEPPIPGASNEINRRPLSSLASGSQTSRFAPNPLMRSSGGPHPSLRVLNLIPSTVTKRISGSGSEYRILMSTTVPTK